MIDVKLRKLVTGLVENELLVDIWFNLKHPRLNGKSPIDFLKEDKINDLLTFINFEIKLKERKGRL